MASPETFFSTFSQIFATLIGFIIAISTVVYSLERRRREDRTDDFRQELNEFRTRNINLVSNLVSAYENAAPETFTDDFEAYGNEPEEIVQRAKEVVENSDSHVLIVHANMLIISENLRRLDGRLDVQLIEEVVDDIESRMSGLKREYFLEENENNLGLYKELTGEEDISDQYLLDTDVFDRSYTENIIEHMNNHRISFPENPHDKTVLVPPTGTELYTIRLVIDKFEDDFSSVQTASHRTLIEYDPHIIQTIKMTIGIILFGVIVPLIILFNYPPSILEFELTGGILLFVQAFLLLISTLILIASIELITAQVYPSYDEKFSCVTRFFIAIIE